MISLVPWLRSLRPSRRPVLRPAHRLVLEQLEDRLMPSAVGVAADGAGHNLLLFDPATGLQTGLVHLGMTGTQDAVISPDGRLAYVNGTTSGSGAGILWAVDLTTHALASGTNPISVPIPPADLAVTPDGKFLLATDQSSTNPIVVIDTATRAVVSTFATGTPNTSVEVTPNGDVLVGSYPSFVGSPANQLRRYTLNADGTLTYTGQSLDRYFFNATAAPNGLFGAATNSGDNPLFFTGTVASFAVSGMGLVNTVSIPEGVYSLAFSPDGTKLFVRGKSWVYGFTYNPVTGAIGSPLFTVAAPPGNYGSFGVDVIDVTDDGTRVYTSSGNSILALDPATGAVLGSTTVAGAAFVGVDVRGVANAPPVAAAGGPYALPEGGSLALAAAAGDPDGDPDGDPLAYAWDVNGDGDFTDAAGASPVLSWNDLVGLGINDGSSTSVYGVRVRADDGQGHVVTSPPAPLTVTNVAPTATLANDGPVVYGTPVAVHFGTPSDPSPADTAAGFTSAYSLDGTTFLSAPGGSVTLSGLDAGTYTVFGRVTDKDGDGTTSTTVVTVTRAVPTVTAVGGHFVYDGLTHPGAGSVTGVGGEDLGAPALSYQDDAGNPVAVPVEPGLYTVTAAFAGNGNYEPGTATAGILIAFEVRTLTDLSRAFHAGRTIPIKLQLVDAAGQNVSAAGITLSAVRLERVSADGTRTAVTLEDAGNANPGNLFRYDAALGGYIFNLSTRGLRAGTYAFSWVAEGDPSEHELTFGLV